MATAVNTENDRLKDEIERLKAKNEELQREKAEADKRAKSASPEAVADKDKEIEALRRDRDNHKAKLFEMKGALDRAADAHANVLNDPDVAAHRRLLGDNPEAVRQIDAQPIPTLDPNTGQVNASIKRINEASGKP